MVWLTRVALRRALALLAACFTLFAASAAWAIPISVDAGDYTGSWYAAGSWHTGQAVVELAAGTQTLTVGITGAGNFSVAIDANGNVASSTQITGGARSARFNTRAVTFAPADYAGCRKRFLQVFAVLACEDVAPSVSSVSTRRCTWRM
ncbi:MAG: hypothetical protein HY908_16935 [Myxococcales bacterium]|nr:hypothetical protein [Myxococcales bacterium]